MIKFPAVTIFDDTILLDAIKQLSPKLFKVFVYLYYRAQKYEETGQQRDSSSETDLLNALQTERYELVSAFITLRHYGILTMLSVQESLYNKPPVIDYCWVLPLSDSGNHLDVLNNHSTPPLNFDESNRHIEMMAGFARFIVIGTQQIDTFVQKKKTKHRNSGKHWETIRAKVLERDGKKCMECGSANKLEAHHLTYENEGCEKLEDLITLCKSCHARKPKRSNITTQMKKDNKEL